ncbi:MAG: 2-oxoacid:ferredoxin oxidoreductase subunit beta [Deltaproteobacteria bacterium]|nr:2-oxoacid:ferredoxin oxidoreductase subunit beta [Deltaproteobacteria bacterium]
MVTLEDYGTFETAWCPGCGNFSILSAVKKALVGLGLKPHQVLLVSGIGQAAKAPHYIRANVFNGLHGRALPVATGAKLANPELTVIAESGDGCTYGEGGNHFLAAIRRNINLTLLVHNNQIYGLTKGQASPTTEEGRITKAQPQGVPSAPFNPLAVAVAMQAGFVARAFSGMADHLTDLIQQAVSHHGFSLIDILQPCISFNLVNTLAWYKKRCYALPDDYDPAQWEPAMKTAMEWGERIPVGVIYRNKRPSFEDHFPVLKQGPLVGRGVDQKKVKQILGSYA